VASAHIIGLSKENPEIEAFEKKGKKYLERVHESQVPVVHTYNSSYLGG
jgi:hypothetical protein